MSSNNLKKSLIQKKDRSYLNRDFDSFKIELLNYATKYYPDRIRDFGDASLGGMFNELTAYVGDVMSFYLDHQFNETNLETAIEPKNIERQVRLAGVKITGASPASCNVNFYVSVEAELYNGSYRPKEDYLPIIQIGTKIQAGNGTVFELVEDLDFSKRNSAGNLAADVKVLKTDNSGNPTQYSLNLAGQCTSGETIQEQFSISNSFIPFRTITLGRSDVSEIIRVIDADLNEYYEVPSLSNDVVFKRVVNTNVDSSTVPESIHVIPAPYRFITKTSFNTALTTLVFGSGKADSLDDDIIPDPSEVALPLFGDRKTFSRVAIDPNALLATNSLGVSPTNTTLTVTYRAGGGISHNVAEKSIRRITSLKTKFNVSVPVSKIAQIRSNIEVNNLEVARGGENTPSIEEFRNIAINNRNSQSRIVTKSDLVSRVYTMPTNLGRVFRVSTSSNPTNPLASLLYVISRDENGYLVTSPDTLKVNLAKYLNEFRLTSDAYDILDAQIINFGLTYTVALDSGVDKTTTIARINQRISNYFDIKNTQIDQPIIISDILNLIINQDGVISLEKYRFNNMRNKIVDRQYSDTSFDLMKNTTKGMISPPTGGIFELKYPNYDIVGNAV